MGTLINNCGRSHMDDLLQETRMLNYNSPEIQILIKERNWGELDEFNKIKEIYNFVRDEIKFGYNVDDSITASEVLKDGYGQCNTKATLLMALLRGVGVPCRIHGFTIDKKLQKGAMTGFVYASAPQNIFHSWAEVCYRGSWYELEGVILDAEYLTQLRKIYSGCMGAFCGYGVAVSDFQNPVIDWNANNTYIQSEGVVQDFGVYNAPDELLKEHHMETARPSADGPAKSHLPFKKCSALADAQKMSALKCFLFRHLGRHLMNRNVRRIRNKRV